MTVGYWKCEPEAHGADHQNLHGASSGLACPNPLDALPASNFTEPMVFARTAGEVQVWIADPVLVHEALVTNADALGKRDQVRGSRSRSGKGPSDRRWCPLEVATAVGRQSVSAVLA